MLRLLGRATSGNVQKVIFLLEELGIAYQREDYGRQFGNTGGEYLKLNPNGKVPTLVDGELVIWESNTILRYLAARENSGLLPQDLAARSQVERWMDWLLASLSPPYVTVFVGSRQAAEERGAAYAAAAADVAKQLVLLDQAMAGNNWLAGASFSLADIALAPIAHRCLNFDIERPVLGRLDAWHERLNTRPAFITAVGG